MVRLNKNDGHRHDVSVSEDNTGIGGGDRGEEERKGREERKSGEGVLVRVFSSTVVRRREQSLTAF